MTQIPEDIIDRHETSPHDLGRVVQFIDGTETLIKPEHLVNTSVNETFTNITTTDFAQAFSGGQQQLKEVIPKKSAYDIIQKIYLEWLVTVNVANSELIPAPFYVQKVDFLMEGGSNNSVIQTLPGEILWILFGLIPIEQREELARLNGFTEKFIIDLNQNITFATQQKRSFLPLLGAFYEPNDGLDMQLLNENLKINIYTNGNIIAITGAGASVTCNGMNIVMNQKLHSQESKMQSIEHSDTKNMEWNYLDWVDCTKSGVVINGGIKTRVQLDNAKGKSIACFIVGIRTSNLLNNLPSPTVPLNNYNVMRFMNLFDGLLDLETQGGQSILFQGSPKVGSFLKNAIMPKQLPGDIGYNTNFYLLPFCNNFKEAVEGVMNGYRYMEESTYQLAITPPGLANTFEVQTITNNAAVPAVATGGNFRISFNGGLSDPIPFNAAVAVIKLAWDSMPAVKSYNANPVLANQGSPSITVSGTLAAVISPTISFDQPGTYPLIQIISEGLVTGAANPISYTTTKSTPGLNFWVNGTYLVSIWGGYFRRFIQSNGYSKVIDL